MADGCGHRTTRMGRARRSSSPCRRSMRTRIDLGLCKTVPNRRIPAARGRRGSQLTNGRQGAGRIDIAGLGLMVAMEGKSEQIVLVVDDDESVRVALTNLFRSISLKVEVFNSAAGLLQSKLPDFASCLVLDIRLPGVSGLEFQDTLAKAGIHIPIVFMTGHGDIPMSVKAMKAGAVDFLPKPFRDQDMLD